MSFILEALKKSEQQRQQQNTSQQKVRKRTLSLHSRRQEQRPYWIVAATLSLVLILSWWFYDRQEPEVVYAPKVSETTRPSTALSQATSPSHAMPASSTVIVQQQSAEVVESSPVPRAVSTPARQPTSDERITTVIIDEPEPRSSNKASSEQTSLKLPRYLDLSRELRDQMPRLSMSMHYYINNPARRMVRINNLLLHEGDGISNNLQVIEITRTGATMDFLGKIFEMSSVSR